MLCIVGFLPRVTECLTDSSWFVKKAAFDLTSKIIFSIVSNITAAAACSDAEDKMLTTVFAPIITDKCCDISRFSICLEVLENRELLVPAFAVLHLDREQIVERLCTILKHLPSSFYCDDVTRILEILSSVCEFSDYWNEANRELLRLVTVLMNDGRILLAVTVAVWLLQRSVAA